MKKIVVRYKVKKDRVAENEQLIEAVFKALDAASPPGIRYASFKLEDGVSFMHLVSFETEGDDNPLGRLPEFKKFTENIAERCDEPPAASTLQVMGNYQTYPS
jgi:hypothetical protein